MRRTLKLCILLFPKLLCTILILSLLLLQRSKKHNFIGEPSVAYLSCDRVDLRGTISLFETRSRLSCNGHRSDSAESVSWAQPSNLICHTVPADTFEPINTIYATRTYNKISSCNFSFDKYRSSVRR